MSPDMSSVRKKVGYPLYGADFDPLNPDFLLVGGGGGSSSTGVPNRISLIDTSRRSELNEIVDIDLPSNEDSVVSLAVAQSGATSLVAYAGINSGSVSSAASSQSQSQSSRNEHFRSFAINLPARRPRSDMGETGAGEPKEGAERANSPASSVGTQALTRVALFGSAVGPPNDCYQRVLRLSPPTLDDGAEGEKQGVVDQRRLKKRITAIASGLAPRNEILTLSGIAPTPADVISRINLDNVEAADLDLIETDSPSQPCTLAYATDTDVFLQRLPRQKTGEVSEPVRVWRPAAVSEGGPRSKVRALRFLSTRYLAVVQNRPARSGVDLMILKTDKAYTQAQVVLTKRIKGTKQAVGFDVCALSAATDGSQQFVVAIAGQESSVQILTIDWLPGYGMTKFHQVETLAEVHNGPITRIVFSTFFPPTLPVSGKTRPQFIRLASVGVDQTVVVHTLPLRPSPSSGTGATHPRYVLTPPSSLFSDLLSVSMAVLVVAVVAFFMQCFVEIRGVVPPTLGATDWLPGTWQNKIGRPYVFADGDAARAATVGGGLGPVIPESMPPTVESAIDRLKLSEASVAIENLQAIESSISASLSGPTSVVPSIQDVRDTLSDLVSRKRSDPDSTRDTAIVVRAVEDGVEQLAGEVSAGFHHTVDIVKEGGLKKWEQLTEQEKKTWKQKLEEAGHWTEKQGETVLKGIFFGKMAGIVGAFAAG